MSDKTTESERVLTDKQFDELQKEINVMLNKLPSENDMIHFDYVFDFAEELQERILEIVSANLKGQGEARPFNARVRRLAIPEKQKIAEIATGKRDEELRDLKTTKGSFSAADVRIILEAVAELNA